MKLAIGRIFSAFLAAGGWLLAGVRLVLDLIGYSTLPEDVVVAKGRLDQAFDLILSAPWWAVWGFALLTTFWLILVSWPRAVPQQKNDVGTDDAASAITQPSKLSPLDVYDGPDHDKLVRFVSLFLLPACWNQIHLQEAILKEIPGHDALKEMAQKGLLHGYEFAEFRENLDKLTQLENSPPTDMTLGQLIDAVSKLENRAYREFGMQLHALTKAAGVDPKIHRSTATAWNEWCKSHEELVAAFNDIKTSSAYDTKKYGDEVPSLYRPVRPSRWGEISDFIFDPN